MTKYRIVSDGKFDFLQYLHERKFLFLFTLKTWKYITWPYYDKYPRDFIPPHRTNIWVCDLNNDLTKFAKNWPNINDYFKWAKTKQKRLEEVAAKEALVEKKNKKEVKYL